MKKTLITSMTLTLLIFAAPAAAQFYPDPVDLGINNDQQQFEEWFWPALARQTLLKHGPQPLTQCQIMSLALSFGDAPPGLDCCLSPEPTPTPDQGQDQAQNQDFCKRPLDHREIIKVIEQFGLRAEIVPKPATAEQVLEYLSEGRALLVEFYIAKDKKHAYLVRGLSWSDEGQPLLKINDPNVTEPFLAPLAEEVPGWQTVIAIQ